MPSDRKNIGSEMETPTEAPAPEQLAPNKAESAVTDPAPAEKAALVDKAQSAAPESHGPAVPEQPKPEKEARQTATPDKGDSAQIIIQN